MEKYEYSYSATFKLPIDDVWTFRIAIGDEVIFDNAPDLPPFVPLSQIREREKDESADNS
jgi:hypothetical protein